MMKKQAFLLVIMSFLTISLFSQSAQISGFWLTEEGDSQIQIFQTNDGPFSGKIVWMQKDLEAKDDKNPNLKLRNQKIFGLQILSNFTYNAKDKEWINGTIYDPKNGKVYDCYMWFDNDINTLKIRGFVLGMRFLGRETTWKREKGLRQIVFK
jgi:uncharacterized protein (DUF2147 family)